jgi:hypothetical protein
MIFAASLAIIWSSVFIFSGFFGMRLYRIENNKMSNFLKKVKYASLWNNDEPEGWIVGWGYIGYIYITVNYNGINKELFLLSTIKCYQLTDNEDCNNKNKNENEKNKQITFAEREGNAFWRLGYVTRLIKITKTPTDKQSKIISQIINDFQKNNYSITLLCGKPGTGKSMIAPLICDKLLKEKNKVTLCDTFNPTDPGDTFSSLYTKISPSENNPLVVVLEEIDIIIHKIHNNLIDPHKDIPIQIKNKIDWNLFLDRFDRKIYPHVILILTTNQPIEYFDNIDESYMRHGRITLKINVK